MIKYHVPTEQFGFVEGESIEEVQEAIKTYKEVVGLDNTFEFCSYLISLFDSDAKEWGTADDFNERPKHQQDALQAFKRFIKRKIK